MIAATTVSCGCSFGPSLPTDSHRVVYFDRNLPGCRYAAQLASVRRRRRTKGNLHQANQANPESKFPEHISGSPHETKQMIANVSVKSIGIHETRLTNERNQSRAKLGAAHTKRIVTNRYLMNSGGVPNK